MINSREQVDDGAVSRQRPARTPGRSVRLDRHHQRDDRRRGRRAPREHLVDDPHRCRRGRLAALQLAGYRVDFTPSDNSARASSPGAPPRSPAACWCRSPTLPSPRSCPGSAGSASMCSSCRRTARSGFRSPTLCGRMSYPVASPRSWSARAQWPVRSRPSSHHFRRALSSRIGPRTAFDARAAGLTVDVIAEERSADSLVVLLEHVVQPLADEQREAQQHDADESDALDRGGPRELGRR